MYSAAQSPVGGDPLARSGVVRLASDGFVILDLAPDDQCIIRLALGHDSGDVELQWYVAHGVFRALPGGTSWRLRWSSDAARPPETYSIATAAGATRPGSDRPRAGSVPPAA